MKRDRVAPPRLLGQEVWTQAALCGCAHLGQLCAELKRRHKAKQARALLRAALRAYVEWDYRSAA